MVGVRPNSEETSVRSGRSIMIGILAGINSGQKPLARPSMVSSDFLFGGKLVGV